MDSIPSTVPLNQLHDLGVRKTILNLAAKGNVELVCYLSAALVSGIVQIQRHKHGKGFTMLIQMPTTKSAIELKPLVPDLFEALFEVFPLEELCVGTKLNPLIGFYQDDFDVLRWQNIRPDASMRVHFYRKHSEWSSVVKDGYHNH